MKIRPRGLAGAGEFYITLFKYERETISGMIAMTNAPKLSHRLFDSLPNVTAKGNNIIAAKQIVMKKRLKFLSNRSIIDAMLVAKLNIKNARNVIIYVLIRQLRSVFFVFILPSILVTSHIATIK